MPPIAVAGRALADTNTGVEAHVDIASVEPASAESSSQPNRVPGVLLPDSDQLAC
jgi:hypothetical protein